jgi:hypothetical protein
MLCTFTAGHHKKHNKPSRHRVPESSQLSNITRHAYPLLNPKSPFAGTLEERSVPGPLNTYRPSALHFSTHRLDVVLAAATRTAAKEVVGCIET